MKVSMSLQTSLLQTLTPQQIQYLKLLQLPILQLEQHVRQEIEQNPMLDETSDDIVTIDEDSDFVPNETMVHTIPQDAYDGEKDHEANYEEQEPYQEEHRDPFDFYESAWNEGNSVDKTKDQYEDDDDFGIVDRFASPAERTPSPPACSQPQQQQPRNLWSQDQFR